MPIPTTQIEGTVRSSNGKLYPGALIEIYLAKQMIFSGALVGNEISKTFSNIYGTFTLKLAPTDSIEDNYYVFKIIKDTTNFYKKIVPQSSTVVRFEDLEDYVDTNTKGVPFLGS